MILEIAFVEVAPERHSDFEKAVKRAVSEVLSIAPGFIDFEMHKGIDGQIWADLWADFYYKQLLGG